jgi:hypothetical protein
LEILLNYNLKITIGALAIAVVGCGKSEYKPVPVKDVKVEATDKVTPEQLYPLKVGNKWTYALEISREIEGKPAQTGTVEIGYEVKSVSNPSTGVTRGVIMMSEEGKEKDEQVWEIDSTGVHQISVGKTPIAFSPKQTIVKFPLKFEDIYDYKGTGITPLGETGTMDYKFSTHEMQPVDTDSGRMSGFFIESSGTFKSPKAEGVVGNNSWFVPGVGLARFKQVVQIKGGRSSLTLRLKSYTIK